MSQDIQHTKELKLSDYASIRSAFCFLDETGSFGDLQDKYFTIGLLKVENPQYVQKSIENERNRRHFYSELKFNKITERNVEIILQIVDKCLRRDDISFCSYTVTNKMKYLGEYLTQWRAYEVIAGKAIEYIYERSEILILIADHVSTPKKIDFEKDIKQSFNQKFENLSIAGVCRFDSKSNDLLQITDLLIGAISYGLKVENGYIPGSKAKLRFVDYLRKALGISLFTNGSKKSNFKIIIL